MLRWIQIRLFICLSLVLSFPALSAQATDYLHLLRHKARVQDLARQREWRVLLHYREHAGGWRSEVDDPVFFNHPDGKDDPQAELDATLAAFFAPPVQQGQHPQCRFIARYTWLEQRLAFDPARLPEHACAGFEKWSQELDAAALTLIFPAAYLNNPSSMFGHTLLRIDAAEHTEDTRLLGQALNYAAVTGSDGGVPFAVKGIVGLYPGVFSMLPYYRKVKEYSDLENRDVWEYRLDITPAEIHRMLRHIWELDKIYFDYYFFDENCSYHLLSLLESARPSLRLRERLWPWVIPGDTVRVVAETPDLVREAVFRPAAATRLRHRLAGLSEVQRTQVLRLVDLHPGSRPGDFGHALRRVAAQGKRPDAALLLETAYDYLLYRHAAADEDDPTRTRRLRELLLARSRLPAAAPETVPVPPRPESGHPSFRLSLGLGRRAGENYRLLHLRPAYHDLLDPADGYTHGAQINFLDLRLRNPDHGATLEVDGLTLVDIVSLTPRDRFFQPISWKIRTGWMRRPLRKDPEATVFRTDGGAGLAVGSKWLAYGFAEAALDVGGGLEQGYALGLGGSVGMLADFKPWRVHVHAASRRFARGERSRVHELSGAWSVSVGRGAALRFELARQWWDRERGDSAVELSWQIFF